MFHDNFTMCLEIGYIKNNKKNLNKFHFSVSNIYQKLLIYISVKLVNLNKLGKMYLTLFLVDPICNTFLPS